MGEQHGGKEGPRWGSCTSTTRFFERREEVIKINLGRRSPEKVGGDEELRRVGQCCNSQSSRRRSGRGVQLQILSPGGAAAHQQLVFEGRGVQLQILSPGVGH